MDSTDTYKARVRLGMRQDQIVLHMGGINGDNKRIQFQELGLWAGNFMVSKGIQQGALPLWQRLATKPSEAGILDFYSLSTWLMVLAFIVLMVLFAHLQHNGAGRRNRIFPLKSIAQRLGGSYELR